MIDTTRGSRYAAALAILALTALLVTPFLFQQHTERLRLEITMSLEPAREASSDVTLAVARQVGAIRGFLLTDQRNLLTEYVAARAAENEALQRLAGVTGLDTSVVLRADDLASAALRWNAFNDQVASGQVSSNAAIARLPDQQLKYSATLNASEALNESITRALATKRARIGIAERRWALASLGLGVLAAAAAALVVFMLSASLRENSLARTDSLTGLCNRRGFAELARRELSRAYRNGSVTTVISFDLDGFKQVNDRQGHAAGDRLLKSVAEGIRTAIRAVDIGARLGGDEFAVLLSDNRAIPPEGAVERVREAITDHLRHGSWPVTLSVGAVTVHDPRRDVDELIHESDALMYAVKNAGKGAMRHEILLPVTSA